LLKRKPIERLGVNGPLEVKSHPWLREFHWEKLIDRSMTAPFVPSREEGNYDMRCINDTWKDDQELVKQNSLLLGQPSVQALFNGYYFDYMVNGIQNQPVLMTEKDKEKNNKNQGLQSTTAPKTSAETHQEVFK